MYRNNAVALWTVVAVILVPLVVIQIILNRIALPGDVFLFHGTFYTHTGTSSTVLPLLLVSLISALGQLLCVGAVFKLVLDAYLDRTIDWRSAIGFASGKVFSLLWIGILATVLIFIGFVLVAVSVVFLLVVIPVAIWLLVAFSVAQPALMLEGTKGTKALRRSFNLVRGRWWATFARILAAVLLYIVVAAVIGAIASAITHSMTGVTTYLIINRLFSLLAAIVVTPFVAAVASVIYIDLRVRKEALDLELLAAHASGTAPVGATSPPGGSGLTPTA